MLLDPLISKHHSPHPDSRLPAPAIVDQNKVITLSETEVREAILSFPNGSAGGPDGLSPQHLKDLTSTSSEGDGPKLLKSLLTMF